MLNETQNNKFVILCKELIPEYIIRSEEDGLFLGDFRDKDIFKSFYQYENENINFVFARLHFEINNWIKKYSDRINRGNRYICSIDRGLLNDLNSTVCAFASFFEKIGIEFHVAEAYKKLICVDRVEIENAEEHIVNENFVLPTLILDEAVFYISKGNKFENIRFLIFGAARTKPDVIVRNVLDGNLEVLNNHEVLIYDDDIKDSLTYADFKVWWNKNKDKYSWYNPAHQMNAMELRVQEYYKNNFSKDMFPVLIPQVYLHYDPKDKETRKKYQHNEALIFQRMDFLIIYKGKRIIIEIDGKTHTAENSLEHYSKQLEYDRTMKFLGYEVFRLGGYELTKNFEGTIQTFFSNLMRYLQISNE